MNRDLILVAISLFAWGFGESAFFAFQPLYLEQLGADPIQIGAILGVYGIATAIAHIPAGYLADRLGRRPLIWSAWFIGVVSTWMMALAYTLTGFVVAMLLYGLTMFVLAPLNSYITTARGNLSVGRAITFVSAAFHSGAIVGPLLGGMIGNYYGFRNIYILAGCLFLISFVMILFIRPQSVESITQHDNGRNLLINTRYLVFLGVFFLASFAMYLPQPLSPNYLQNQQDLNLIQIGQLYSISELGIVILSLLLGLLNARLGYLIGQVAVGLFALMLWQGTGFPVYTIAYFLLGGFRASRSLATAYIRSLIIGANMGLAYGLAETIAAGATIIAPLLAGVLYTQNPGKMYAVSVLLICGSIVINALVTSTRSSTKTQEDTGTI
ncbi:MAG: MFS transporter [Anaerolineales bacterium]|nr:MFS transporter [Anaerolineales bacterium]